MKNQGGKKKPFQPTNPSPAGYVSDVLIKQFKLYLEWARGCGSFSAKQTFGTPAGTILSCTDCATLLQSWKLFSWSIFVWKGHQVTPLCDHTCWAIILQLERVATNKRLKKKCSLFKPLNMYFKCSCYWTNFITKASQCSSFVVLRWRYDWCVLARRNTLMSLLYFKEKLFDTFGCFCRVQNAHSFSSRPLM